MCTQGKRKHVRNFAFLFGVQRKRINSVDSSHEYVLLCNRYQHKRCQNQKTKCLLNAMSVLNELETLLRSVGKALVHEKTFVDGITTALKNERLSPSGSASVRLIINETLFNNKVFGKLTASISEVNNVSKALFGNNFTSTLHAIIQSLTIAISSSAVVFDQTRTVYKVSLSLPDQDQSISVPIALTYKGLLGTKTLEASVIAIIEIKSVSVSINVVGTSRDNTPECLMFDPASAAVSIQLGKSFVTPGGDLNEFQAIVNAAALAFDLATYISASVRRTVSNALTSLLNEKLTNVVGDALQSTAVGKKFAAGFNATKTSYAPCTVQIRNACVKMGTPCGPGFVSMPCFNSNTRIDECCPECVDKASRPCATTLGCFDFGCPPRPKYEHVVDIDGNNVMCGDDNDKYVCALSEKCRPPSACVPMEPGACLAGDENLLNLFRTLVPQYVKNSLIADAVNPLLKNKSFQVQYSGIDVTVSGLSFAKNAFIIKNVLDSACLDSSASGCSVRFYVTLGNDALSGTISINDATYTVQLGMKMSAALQFQASSPPTVTVDLSNACIFPDSINLTVVKPKTFDPVSTCQNGKKDSASSESDSIMCALVYGANILAPLLQNTIRGLPSASVSLPAGATTMVKSLCPNVAVDETLASGSNALACQPCVSTSTWILIGIAIAFICTAAIAVAVMTNKRQRSKVQ